jgi:hypothetical protein
LSNLLFHICSYSGRAGDSPLPRNNNAVMCTRQ